MGSLTYPTSRAGFGMALSLGWPPPEHAGYGNEIRGATKLTTQKGKVK